jgi:hypothetical protein
MGRGDMHAGVACPPRYDVGLSREAGDTDCRNDFLKKFRCGEKDLTLGSFMIILQSSQEIALRNCISRTIPDATNRVFGTHGIITILNDDAMRDIRNKAAHDEVLRRDEAQQTRAWALQILRQV